jgi:hypothetical protein
MKWLSKLDGYAQSLKRQLAFAGIAVEMSNMTCTVKVANGTIRLPSDLKLPDGAEVELTIPDAVAQPLTLRESAELRGKLAAWEEDWNAPGMEVYDRP